MNRLMMLISLLLMFTFASCVSTKAPSTENKAKKKLSKHLKGIANISKSYPNLLDTLTTTVYDTIVLEEHTVDTVFQVEIDTVKVESLLDEYTDVVTKLKKAKAEINKDNSKIRELTIKETQLKEKLFKATHRDTTFVYSDSLVSLELMVKDGTIVVKNIIKQKEIPTETSIVHNIDTDCYTRKDFWLDWKFYVLMLIILLILFLRRRV